MTDRMKPAEDDAGPPVLLRGIGVSPGTGVGPALIYPPTAQASDILAAGSGDPAVERERLRLALGAAVTELHALSERVALEIGHEEAGIFDAQALMLEDPTIAEAAEALIKEGASGASALSTAAEEQAAVLAALPGPLWQARAVDVRDAARRALAHLHPAESPAPSLMQRLEAVSAPVVIVANDLSPSDTAQLRTDRVCAIALAGGSSTAHAAILARALGISAVLGLGEALLSAVHEGDDLVVNASDGTVLIRPDAASRERAQHLADQNERERVHSRKRAGEWRTRPGQTRDGMRVPLLANIGTVADAQAAAQLGAEGIGLLRTEFLFADRATLPDEREQADAYAAIIAALGPLRGPIIVRTLDAGADKPLPALAPYTRDLPPEANPALGVRGIRLHTLYPALLATQLRAILRVAQAHPNADLRIMLPMVATLDEMRAAQAVLVAESDKMRDEGITPETLPPLGIMVETPAAAFSAGALAREAAFFSIGTNDLAQYVMAADRLNPRLAELSRPEQPSVLRAVAAVTEAAHAGGRHVGVCGEMAGDPRLAALLVGLGVDELSMTPTSILAVKESLAARTSMELRELALRVLQAGMLRDADRLLDAALA